MGSMHSDEKFAIINRYLTMSFATRSPPSKFDTQKQSRLRPRPTKRMPKLATIYSCTDNQRLNSLGRGQYVIINSFF